MINQRDVIYQPAGAGTAIQMGPDESLLFQAVSEQIRATLQWQVSFDSSRVSAIRNGAPSYIVQLYTLYLSVIEQSLASNRAMTPSTPWSAAG